jgi:membrane-associated protease RseP (regulator of RpoE activity)
MSPVVTGVVENGPAAEAGILPGDTLLALDGVGLATEPGRRSMARLRAGIPVNLRVGRAGSRRDIRVIPGVRVATSFFRTNGSAFGYSYSTAPQPTEEVAVFRFEDDSGEVSEFHFAPAPGAPAAGSPQSPQGYVVFREDPSGTLRVDVGDPAGPVFRLNGERVELAQLEGYLKRQQGTLSRLDSDMDVRIERIETDGGMRTGGVERTHLILQNAPLAQHLETVRIEALTDARAKLESVVRLRAELASRGEVPPRVASAYTLAPRPPGYVPSASETGEGFFGTLTTVGPAVDGRLAGAEFRPLTPALAEYFSVKEGLLVLRVLPETPAARLGLRDGDVVVGVGQDQYPSLATFRSLVGQMQLHGGTLKVKWNRKGRGMEGDLTSR